MKLLYTALFTAFTMVLFAQSMVTITDADLQNSTYTWTKDNIYLLDGFVFLEAGGVLNIEAGTVVKAKEVPSSNDLTSALVITRGAQINAIGAADAPIIFTTELDDTTLSDELSVEDRGLWGGLIILGNGSIADEASEKAVEGLSVNDTRSLYGGGTNETESSGILKYVSIRHGGAELAPGEEINGLTLGAVGSGTTIDYIEVISNSDDGIEWFGGTVRVNHASVAFCGDDSYDFDHGWRGGGQYWFSLQSEDEGDNGGEHDGAKPDANTPSSNPVIYNATFIGAGVDGSAKNEHALYFRDGSRGTYANSIFTDFANYALQVEDRASGVDSRLYMENGELSLLNNIWFGFGEGDELNTGTNGILQATDDAEDASAQFLIDHLVANNNSTANPELGGISRLESTNGLDPRAFGATVTRDIAAAPADYNNVGFKGAFCADGVWIKGWTALDEYGVLKHEVPASNCDLVAVEDLLIAEKAGFVLEQNAPNPASINTTIRFTLPTATAISLTVYDMKGGIVASLIQSEKMTAGEHAVVFDANNLPKGTYLYSLYNTTVTLGRVMLVSE